MSSRSSSIFKPSGRAATSAPFPLVDTCETRNRLERDDEDFRSRMIIKNILLGLDVLAEELWLRIVEILVLDVTKSLSVEPSPDSAVICIITGFLSLPENNF